MKKEFREAIMEALVSYYNELEKTGKSDLATKIEDSLKKRGLIGLP